MMLPMEPDRSITRTRSIGVRFTTDSVGARRDTRHGKVDEEEEEEGRRENSGVQLICTGLIVGRTWIRVPSTMP